MTLNDIGDYKNRLLNMILDSNEVGELLTNGKFDPNDAEDLIYKNIFPFLYVEDVQTTTQTYVCIEVDVPRTMDFTFKDMKVIVWCYCHKNIMKYRKKGYKGTRSDILSTMVDNLLNSSNNFGLGRLKLQSATYFSPGQKFYGRQLIYECAEFNIEKKI